MQRQTTVWFTALQVYGAGCTHTTASPRAPKTGPPVGMVTLHSASPQAHPSEQRDNIWRNELRKVLAELGEKPTAADVEEMMEVIAKDKVDANATQEVVSREEAIADQQEFVRLDRVIQQ